MTGDSSRARNLGAGAAAAMRLPIGVLREPMEATTTAFEVHRARPDSVGAGGVLPEGLLDRGRLPQERRQLARHGHRDLACGLGALPAQPRPAGRQPPLSPPGDLAHARVKALLASGQRVPDRRTVTVVPGGLDQQAPGVAGPGLGDRPLAALVVGGVLARVSPTKSPTWVGRAKRSNGPTSATSPVADSVSMPRKARRRLIGSANGSRPASWAIASSSAPRRCSSPCRAVR